MICGGAAAAAWAANPMIISTTSSSTTRTSIMMAMTTIASNNTRKRTVRIRRRKGITTRINSCCCYSSSFYPNININIIIIKNKKKNPNVILMQWQDCKVKMDVEVPISVAYKCYSDREAIPRWMPFISTVKILEDKPDLSRWSLKYNAFGQDIEFSWLARNMQPIPNQKIHWRSLEGLPNRGAVRFYPKGSSSCTIELTVSYEVPQLLVPVASALQPFIESLLARGLERFAKFAGSYSTDSST